MPPLVQEALSARDKVARKILSHHAKTKIYIMLGTMRTDGSYWSGPHDWGKPKITR